MSRHRESSWIVACAAGALFLGSHAVAQHPKTSGENETGRAHVHGEVVDELGRPIAGAGMIVGRLEDLLTAKALQQPLARTDAKGRLSFRVPRERESRGSYVKRFALVSAPGRMSLCIPMGWNPYYPYLATSDEFDLGRIVLPRGGVIRGRVRRPDGRPLEGALVLAKDLLASGHFSRYVPGFYGLVFESQALTDAKGVFELSGVWEEGMSLQVTADGYYDRFRPFVTAREPLVLEMQKGGFVEGRVVDADDKPVKAMIHVTYEVQPTYEYYPAAITGDDGRFRVRLRYPHRYQLAATTISDNPYSAQRSTSKVCGGPTKGMIVKIDRAKEVGTIALRVFAKATGRPVQNFRAAVAWQDPRSLNAVSMERWFSYGALESKLPGKITLPGPRGGQPDTGAILIKAKGFAPTIVKDVNFEKDEGEEEEDGKEGKEGKDNKKAAKLVEIEARLLRESVIEGVVVDEKSGKALPGARVTFSHQGLRDLSRYYGTGHPLSRGASTAQLTDKEGRFRIGNLGKGKYELGASHPGRPDSPLVRIKLSDEEQKNGVRITLPKGVVLTGKVTGARLLPHWSVKLVPQASSNSSGSGQVFFSSIGGFLSQPTGGANAISSTVGADGRFRFLGVGPGRYKFQISVPRNRRAASPLEIPIEPLRVRNKDIERDFDVSEDMPGQVVGKVKLTGAPLRLSRLLLLATYSAKAPGTNRYYGYNQQSLRGFVAADGSFSFPARAGYHMIWILDAATGIVLHQVEDVVRVRRQKDSRVEVPVALAMVRVELRPAREGGKIAASRLQVVVTHPVGRSQNFGRNDSGVGIPLSEGQRQVMLFLPPYETTLLVRSSVYRISGSQSQQNMAPLGELEFTPVLGKINKAEIRVEDPPELEGEEETKKADRLR